MAETYTDSTGKVFPVNQFGRPMGYFDGNTFVFPRFGDQPAVTQPVVEPLAPVAADPVVQPMRQPGMVVQTPNDGETLPPSGPPGGVTAPVTFDRGSLYTNIGGKIGGLTNIPGGGLLGAAIGGALGGRGKYGVSGDTLGGVLGSGLLGPIGALGGGIVGGRIGDLLDMQDILNLDHIHVEKDGKVVGELGRRGFLGTLGYGLGLGPSLNRQLEDYYGINQPGIDPFGGIAEFPSNIIHSGFNINEDDIGDIDPRSGIDYSGPFSDPFQDIADVFDLGGDADDQFDDYGDMGGFT